MCRCWSYWLTAVVERINKLRERIGSNQLNFAEAFRRGGIGMGPTGPNDNVLVGLWKIAAHYLSILREFSIAPRLSQREPKRHRIGKFRIGTAILSGKTA